MMRAVRQAEHPCKKLAKMMEDESIHLATRTSEPAREGSSKNENSSCDNSRS